MRTLRRLRRLIAAPLIAFMTAMALPQGGAFAMMVTTDQILADGAKDAAASARERLRAFIARKEVAAEMRALGVAPAEALARIDALSDAEVAKIAGRLDSMPAGAFAGTLIGALLVVFLVLLVTDILGFTNVYPFVRHH